MQLGIIVAAFVAVVIWGASPVATKVAVAALSPLTVVFFRTVLGGIVALPIAVILRVPFPASREQRSLLLLSGFCGFVAFPLLFTIGVERTSANHASIILACLPVFTGAIAMAWDRRKPGIYWWTGCLIAVCGEALLISSFQEGEQVNHASVFGDGLVIASNGFAALGYVAGGRLQRAGYPSSGTTFWGVVIFGTLLLPAAPFMLTDVDIGRIPGDAWIAVIYLAIGVTIVGYMMWYWALGKGGIERIGLFQFLQPVSGVILAWLLLGETLTVTFIVASMLVLLGVWFALKDK